MSFIEFKNISKSFSNHGRIVRALQNVSLSFEPNGFVCIVGESGSGKTTLINLLLLLERPTLGKIFIQGKDVSLLSERKKDRLRGGFFSFVSQRISFVSGLSSYENIALPLELSKTAYTNEDIATCLTRLGLQLSVLSTKPAKLSGGQKQRIAVARALLKKSPVLVADEPTASLDAKSAEMVFSALQEEAKHRLVIVVTHDSALAQKYGTRIVSIEKGMVVSDKKDKESLPSLSSEQPISLPRSSLSIKTKTKIGFSFLLHRPVRTFIAVILVALSLGALMLSSSFFLLNNAEILHRAIDGSDMISCSLAKPDGFTEQQAAEIYSDIGPGTSFYYSDQNDWIWDSFEINDERTKGFENVIPSSSRSFFTCPGTRSFSDCFSVSTIGTEPIDKDSEIDVMVSNAFIYFAGLVSFEDATNVTALKTCLGRSSSINVDEPGKNGNSVPLKISGIFIEPFHAISIYNSGYFGERLKIALSYSPLFSILITPTALKRIQAYNAETSINRICLPKASYFSAKNYISKMGGNQYSLISEADPYYEVALAMVAEFKYIGAAVSILFLVLSLLSLFLLSVNMVQKENPSILILRTFGAGPDQCLDIFGVDSIILSAVTVSFALAIALSIEPWLNNILLDMSKTYISVFSLSWWIPVILFLLSIFISFLLSLLALLPNYSKHTKMR